MATHQKKHTQIKGLVELVRITKNTQYYATVKTAMGDCRFIVNLLNGDEKMVTLPGRLKGKNQYKMLNAGDFIMIEKDSISNNLKPTYYVLVKYTRDQKNQLKKMGEIVDSSSDLVNDIFEQKEEKEDEEFNVDDI